jgi:hypothetical protein
MARAPIRGSCSHRYFAIFFFFFFFVEVAMADFPFSSMESSAGLRSSWALSQEPFAFAPLPVQTMPQDGCRCNRKMKIIVIFP